MGQLHSDRRSSSGQGSCQGPRRRRCLLKGCEAFFVPQYEQARYCSPACQDAADRWRRWRASQAWRKTPGGRECRRQQCCRYRQRVRERQEAEQGTGAEPVQAEQDIQTSEGEQAAAEAISTSCEGQRPAGNSEGCSCARPGCYELFVPSARCPHQRFCSCLCRKALRRVIQRESRWGRRRKRGPQGRRKIPPWRKKVRRHAW